MSTNNDMSVSADEPPDALPEVKRDLIPLCLVPVLAVVMLPLIGSLSTWTTLTVAGLAMGMIVFVMTSGLTLIFGLMRILNLSHGVFIGLGAFVAASVLARVTQWTGQNTSLTLIAIIPTIVIAMLLGAAVGFAFERLIIRPVAGQPLKTILTTMGGLIIGTELLKAVWGPDPILLPLPAALQGSLVVGGAVFEKYRLMAALFGLGVFITMMWMLNRTKLGLLIRAGVQNLEMVESFGYRIRRLFVAVFVAGCSLASLGGVMWGLYEQIVDADIGANSLVLAIIVIVMGGLGSTGGCFIAAILVGLLTNYAGFLVPKLTLLSNILLMVAITSWRPEGLYPVTRHS